jgi:23S rRNA (guanosine2251-2'-O)-methyltransferase
MVARGDRSGSIPKIVADAKKAGIVIKEVDPKKLDFVCGHNNHQGIAAFGAVKEYSTVEDIFATAEERNEPPFIIICDEIEDPHNLGAIIRTAEAAGAHGVIIPKRRSASLSFTVAKTSAGAVEFMHVARVTNIPQTIDDLKKRGVWVYCADMDGEPFYKSNLKGAIALVIGSEGNGVGRLVKEKCDVTLSMPMKGKINSLNASVAAGILMYEVSRQRD